MQLEALILKSLAQQPRIYVPGWGTFFLANRETRFEHATGAVFPAGKYIAFNPNSSSSATTLHTVVAKEIGGNLEAAESWVRRKINTWQEKIDQGSVLKLEGLGTFRKGGQFLAEQNNPLDAENFGFTQILLHPVHSPSALESKVSASLKVVSEQRSNAAALWKRAAVAAAVSALIGLGIFQSDLPTQAAGWFGPSTEAPTKSIIEKVESDNNAVDVADVVEEEVVAAPVKSAASYSHFIVVGSFKEPQNAHNLAAELEADGLEIHIIEGSLMKVGIGFESRGEAAAELAQIKSSINKHAWIYARR